MTRRERQRRRRKHAHPARRAVLLSAILLVTGLLTAAGLFAGWVVMTADNAPNINQLHARVPGQTSEVFAGNGQSLGYMSSDVVRTYLTQAQQPPMLRRATVAIEDRRFFQHGGVDYEGLLRAAVKDVFDGGGIQGGSTLTMQLVTNVYLPDDIKDQHNLRYKIIQAKLANELESKHSKEWIITQYLNDVPYGTVGGQTAIGVAAASEMFFDKPVQDLDLAQCALLAGLPQAPSDYNPFLDPKLARWRRGLVLQAMAQSGYITEQQARTAQAEPLQVKPNDTYQDVRQPYVFNYVEQQLVKDLGPDGQQIVDRGGLKVYTTINLADQQAAATAIKENEGEPGDPAAALVSIDPANGHILALQNSTTYGTGKGQTVFDYATQAQRQTGSAFKVFALMTLIHDDDGDPSQTYYVSKFLPAGWLPGYPNYSVHTAEDSYQGTINVTKATALSDNTVYAQLGVDLGMNNVDVIAHAMGITSKLCGNPSEVIGGLCQGVSPLQMSDAYATLANGGYHVPTTIISKVVEPGGKVVNLGSPAKRQVFSPGEAYEGTQTLETVLQYGTGTSANYGCPAAGKTGTTSNYTDAWFVGYTPELSTAVWVGYPNSEEYMDDVNGLGPGYGGTLAAPIWRDFMQAASDGYCQNFPQPAQLWHGTAYIGKHTVQPYVPPPAPVYTAPPPVTTTPPATTTPAAPATTTPATSAPPATTPAAPATTTPAAPATTTPVTTTPATTTPATTTPATSAPPSTETTPATSATPPPASGGGGF